MQVRNLQHALLPRSLPMSAAASASVVALRRLLNTHRAASQRGPLRTGGFTGLRGAPRTRSADASRNRRGVVRFAGLSLVERDEPVGAGDDLDGCRRAGAAGSGAHRDAGASSSSADQTNWVSCISILRFEPPAGNRRRSIFTCSPAAMRWSATRATSPQAHCMRTAATSIRSDRASARRTARPVQ